MYLVQAKQAQFSLYEAISAGRLNNYVLLFTVVTVIIVSLQMSSEHPGDIMLQYSPH